MDNKHKKIPLGRKNKLYFIIFVIYSVIAFTYSFMVGGDPLSFGFALGVGITVTLFFLFIYSLIYSFRLKKGKENMLGTFITFIILVTLFAGFLAGEESNEERKTKEKAYETALEEQKTYINMSLNELHTRFFESGLTGLQQEAYWEEVFKNKYVIWEGYVKNIDENLFGKYVVLVNVDPVGEYTITNDVSVEVKKSEINKLMIYKKNSKIKFSGKLDSYGEIMEYFYLKEGEVIE